MHKGMWVGAWLTIYQTAASSVSFEAMGTILCAMYTVISLKLWSYIQVNYWCRTSHRTKRFRAGVTGPGGNKLSQQKSVADLSVQPRRKTSVTTTAVNFKVSLQLSEPMGNFQKSLYFRPLSDQIRIHP